MTSEWERIRAISFDVDDTLYNHDAVVRDALRHALDELAHAHPIARERLSIDGMMAIREQVAAEMKGQARGLDEIRFLAFRRTVEVIAVTDDDLAHHLTAIYLKHRFGDFPLYPDVLPALDALDSRYRLGVLSNGYSFPDHRDLAGRFRFVVLAQQQGVEKPDPRIFAIALAQAGCARDELLHVGDSLEDDVREAQRAGLTAIWVNRKRAGNRTDIRPDGEIDSLLDLLHLDVALRPLEDLRESGDKKGAR